MERKPVDLNQVVLVSFEAIQSMAASRDLRLSLDLTPHAVSVAGDSMRLEQVMVNLLTNGVKYTGSGGTISIKTVLIDGEVEVLVEDTGIGIEAAFLEQIFEPFRQGTSSWLASQSGLGLGLSIARKIVEMHGGRIWAESPGLERGSTFRLRLPVAHPAREERRNAPTWRETTSAPAPGARVLLVEDSEDIVFLMRFELEKMGCIVTTAGDGRAGVEIAKQQRPDLIISDIKMPVADGFQLIRSIRTTPGLDLTPVIALTGFGAGADRERALAAGFDACLSKPAEPEEIAALVGQWTQPQRIARDQTTNNRSEEKQRDGR